jgi:hypothetical protein
MVNGFKVTAMRRREGKGGNRAFCEGEAMFCNEVFFFYFFYLTFFSSLLSFSFPISLYLFYFSTSHLPLRSRLDALIATGEKKKGPGDLFKF